MSLVTTPARALATCSTCSSTRVTSITMTLTDGSVVDFASCHACECRTWTQDGRRLDIATVLGKARKDKAAARVA
jgi:predicted metal-binding protein